MKRQVTAALLAAGTAVAVSAAAAVPAAAATSGSETLSGTIVTSAVSGTRTVISSVVVAKGVFTGVGRIVEIPSLPTDPPNVSRDDLVFPEGAMHLVSTTVGISFSVNAGCLANATLQQPRKSSEAPASSPPQLPASARRSQGRRCLPATRTVAAPSRNRRCTRRICSRTAERCRSDLVLKTSIAAWRPPLGTDHPAGRVTNWVTTAPHTARLQRTLADDLNGSGLGCLHSGNGFGTKKPGSTSGTAESGCARSEH